ncbi:MAG: glycosyltransferase [Dongiaceae bacterium]
MDLTDDPVFGLMVSREPLILWGPSNPPYLAALGTTLAERVGNRRAWFLISLSYTREIDPPLKADLEHFAELRARYPEHRHVVLCNTPQELERYGKAGQAAIVCSANVFIDESVFDIPPPEPKIYDAVYNAALVPYKRHALCTGIDSLALIYHRFADLIADRPTYPAEVRAMLPKASFVNESKGVYRNLTSEDIVRYLGRSHIGLCLSQMEGQMRACAEYLLCGVPVVTTPNVGGRNRQLDSSYSIMADPTPESVARAVHELKERKLDPHFIRRGAMARLKPDRMRLLQLIAAIYRDEGMPLPEADWIQLFRRGTFPRKSPDEVMAETAIAETRAMTPRPA